MTNIQLSSRTDDWHTPKYIIDMVREVIPFIELDPASSEEANEVVQAETFYTEEQDALSLTWSKHPVTIYLNSPGGKKGNKSMTGLFWDKLMRHRDAGLVSEAIFMGFSLEHLAVTQAYEPSLCDFPFCIPRKRIRFVSPEGNFNSPTHSNVIAYIPGVDNNTSKFKKVFSQLGKIMHPSF